MKYLLAFLCVLLSTPSTFANTEFTDSVFPWLKSSGLTSYTQESDFRADGRITRGEAAKFVVAYARSIGLEKDTQNCAFSDTRNYDATLALYTIEACEYGLFRGANGRFDPHSSITEAQALVVVTRTIYGMRDETGSTWYAEYRSLAKDLGILDGYKTTELDDYDITRAQLGTWLYRASRSTATDGSPIVYESDATSASQCSKYEKFNPTKKVCYFECKDELECKSISAQIDAEFALIEKTLVDTPRSEPVETTSAANKDKEVILASYSVSSGERITLKSWKDLPQYQAVWQEIADLSPNTLSDNFIDEFVIYSSPESSTIAYVVEQDNSRKWKISINLPIQSASEVRDQKLTLIHELAHILSLNAGQMEAVDIPCPTYKADEGCTKKESYLNNFSKKFWGPTKKGVYNEKSFVTDYAASNREEDFAESFSFYILAKSFSNTTVRDQKVNFFNTYPDLVTLRQEMRGVLAEDIVRARKQ